MKKEVLFVIFIHLLLIVIPFNSGEVYDNLEETTTQSSEETTSTKVYVNLPNFKVISDNGYDIVTLIFEADTPQDYEGSLFKMESEDITLLTKVFTNLKTKKIIMFQQDKDIAEKIKENGFVVEVK